MVCYKSLKTINQSKLQTQIQFVPHRKPSALTLQTKKRRVLLKQTMVIWHTHTHTYCEGKMQCSLLLNLVV